MEHDWSGHKSPWLYRRRTTRLERLKNVARIMWWRLSEVPPPVHLLSLLTLLVLAGSLAGCQSLSMPPSEQPRNPQPPQISTELPQETYSSRAAESFKTWQQRLTVTPTM